jgi:hypothetical protein
MAVAAGFGVQARFLSSTDGGAAITDRSWRRVREDGEERACYSSAMLEVEGGRWSSKCVTDVMQSGRACLISTIFHRFLSRWRHG